MACLTAGYTIDCTQGGCSGGLSEIFIAKESDVDTITYDPDGSVSSITMIAGPPAGVFYEFDFQDGTASFTENLTVTNCNISVEQTLTFIVPCRNDVLRQRIDELAGCCCGMIVIFTEFGGTSWIIGDKKKRRAFLRENEGLSGAALADQNQETITIGVSTNTKAVAFTGTVPT